MSFSRYRVGLMATAAAFVAGGAFAQQQQAQVGGIEEIVVTARQRAESLQEIPLAIAAFSAQDIQKAGFTNLGDIALQSSGIQFNPNMSGAAPGRFNSVIRIRGVNVLSPLPHLQATSLFVDGVYSLGGAQVLPINDLERVEIIKGPQSAFFGRNTFAGAINYITKNPNLDEYEGKVDFTGATYNYYETNVQHTGPLVDGKLGYLANIRLYNKGAQWTATDGGKLGKQVSESASLALYSEPFDGFSIKVRGFYQEDDDGPPGEAFLRGRTLFGNDTCDGTTDTSTATSFPLGARAGTAVTLRPKNFVCGKVPSAKAANLRITANTSLRPAILSRVRTVFDGETNRFLPPQASPDFLIQNFINRKFIPGIPDVDGFGMRRNTERYSLNANYEFGGGYTATLTAGYNKTASNWILDFDHTDVESWYSADPQTGKDKSAELRFASPGEDRFRWVAGATYYKQTFITNGAGGLALSMCAADPTCAIGPGNFGLAPTNGDKAKVWAGYGQVSYDIVEQLTLDIEYRYMQDERTNTQSAGAGFRNFTEKFKQKTPRVILTYKPSDDLTVYGQASRGTLPGVINGLVSICSNDTFLVPYIIPVGFGIPGEGTPSTASECAQIANQSPGGATIPSTPAQYLDAAEVGIKTNLMDGSLKANVTGYYYKWKNLPFGLSVRYFRDADNPALRDRIPNAFNNTLAFSTSGDAKFKGLEFETAYAVNENWDIQGNLSWNDNEFTTLILTGSFSAEVRNPLRPNAAGALVRSTDPTVVSAANNYSGRTQIRYPEWQGNLSTTYTDKFVGDWDWFARADAIYFGSAFVDFSNYAKSQPYWLVHTRAGVEKENLRIELFVRNLFDTERWAGASALTDFAFQGDLSFTGQGIGLGPQDKRQFGLRVNYGF